MFGIMVAFAIKQNVFLYPCVWKCFNLYTEFLTLTRTTFKWAMKWAQKLEWPTLRFSIMYKKLIEKCLWDW